MSLKIVIVAVIALVVLIVLVMIFTGKTRLFGKATASCEGRGGECQDGPRCPEGYLTHRTATCQEDNKICCAAFDIQTKKGSN